MKDEKFIGRYEQAIQGVSSSLKPILSAIRDQNDIQEIRLRIGQPLSIVKQGKIFFVQKGGYLSRKPDCSYLVTKGDVEETFRILCNFSVYSHQNELRNGFLTLKGGHRAGVCGTAVIENGQVAGLRDISAINIRIARQVNGAGDEIIHHFRQEGLVNTLICGEPGSGKTTILRDVARQLSSGTMMPMVKICVIDERGEIGACYQGVSQNDLGPCCEVFDGYPKGEGMQIALRCFSPHVMICDEIGTQEDIKGVLASFNAGVTVIASIHASNLQDLYNRPSLSVLMEVGAFQKFVFLKGRGEPCKIKEIIEVKHGQDNRNTHDLTGMCSNRPAVFEPIVNPG